MGGCLSMCICKHMHVEVMSGITLDSSSTLSNESGSLQEVQSFQIWLVLLFTLLWVNPCLCLLTLELQAGPLVRSAFA